MLPDKPQMFAFQAAAPHSRRVAFEKRMIYQAQQFNRSV
jgi:Txe/YoeB family toxin of Txe-Axe toxin-antitoxin module